MKRVFIDANIIVDLANESNDLHFTIIWLLNRLIKENKTIVCSPTSFAIVFYFLGKKFIDKKVLRRKMIKLFEVFEFSREDDPIMRQVFDSKFVDLEDALQYFSAVDAGVDAIITRNEHDFFPSRIPVFHPVDFVNRYYNI